MNCLKRLIKLIKNLFNRDMSEIKMFKGKEKPNLKKGEWASDGIYAYLGIGDGNHKIFQGVFDSSFDQKVAGFQFLTEKNSFIIPRNTPFSEIQILLNTLPKSLKNSDLENEITLFFENTGITVNDLGKKLKISNFNYTIRFKGNSEASNSSFFMNWWLKTIDENEQKIKIGEGISIINSRVVFYDIEIDFEAEDASCNSNIPFVFELKNSQLEIKICRINYNILNSSMFCQNPAIIIEDNGNNSITLNESKLNIDKGSVVGSMNHNTQMNILRTFNIGEEMLASIVERMKGGILLVDIDSEMRASSRPIMKAGLYIGNGAELNNDTLLKLRIMSENLELGDMPKLKEMVDNYTQQ